MTEQTPETETYDPSDQTVDQVNEHLATLDPEGDEHARILQAERDGKARVGILGDEPDPEDAETPQGTDLKAETFSEAAKNVPVAEGEKYAQGYSGHSPARANGEDLTLAAVLKDA